MSTYEYAVVFRAQLADLPRRRFACQLAQLLYLLWEPHYQRLAWFLAGKPGIRGQLWLMFHIREWQKSSEITGLEWLLGTFVVYELVSQLGYGWEMNVVVSLAFDIFTFAVHKKWVFRRPEITVPKSYSRNFAAWGFFLGINVLLSWLLIQRAGLGAMYGRGALGVYGIAMNPVMFKLRDRLIFNEINLREAAAARCRFEMNRAMAISQSVLLRTRA